MSGPETLDPEPGRPVDSTRSDGAAPSGPAASGAPGTPAAPPGLGSFGRYDLIEVLGSGGMGLVYRAWHRDLKAFCAVKVLRAGLEASAEGRARFQREAQVAARLRHPGIVAVHDFGIEDGRAYCAMELVAGTGLDRALDDPAAAGLGPPDPLAPGLTRRGLAPRDAARITREVAEAIDYAHRQGVIHRDLKPANVLLDAQGRARVLDFGLAKALPAADATTAVGQTASGTVLGTLAYMAPEQAGGETRALDARTDVYALGVMLYEMVTGRLPFEAESDLGLLARVLRCEPARPRATNPALPADLEIIVQKAMAKEPARRYAQAGDLAADLARFLAGTAIEARAPDLAYRLGAWLRPRRGVVAAGALLLAAASVAVALAVHAYSARAEEAALRARLLVDLRKKAGLYVDAALALRRSGLPVHKAEDEYLPPLRRAVEEAERADPAAAEPRYHLGRLYRALLRFPAARAEQDRALARDPGFLPSLYERCLLRARDYRYQVTRLRDEWTRREGQRLAAAGLLTQGGAGAAAMRARPADEVLALADPPTAALHDAFRAELERLAAGGQSAARTEVRFSPGMPDCARALLVALSAPTRAGPFFEAALRADPTLEEAYEGLAQAALAAGDGNAAIAAYSRGLAADAGYAPMWFGRGVARGNQGLERMLRGEDPEVLYAAAEEDLGRALDLDAGAEEIWLVRGQLRMNWGNHRLGRGLDPVARYAAAEGDFGRALALAPGQVEAWIARANALTNWATWKTGRGEDPEPLYTRAEKDYARALELDPTLLLGWTGRGTMRLNWGALRYRRGGDAEPLYAAAETDLGQALALDPRAAGTWAARGAVRMNWGAARQAKGQDPRDLYARSELDYVEALKLVPRDLETRTHLGIVRMNLGTYLRDRHEDPSALYARAETDFAEVLARAPASADPWLRRGALHYAWAVYERGQKRDPGPRAGPAIEDLTRAIVLNPANAEARWRRGKAHFLLAHWSEAIADYEMALRLNPTVEKIVAADLEQARARVSAPGK